ncbi:MAG: ribosome small subunit-dependent GTPase A [Gammaproteobacteria bacterium]|nr:ribosome small subunit-dependent GTPase A [Gammaproteobacteria bacterium]
MSSPGQIITRQGDRLIVATSLSNTHPNTVRCAQRKKLPPLAIGDWVTWEPTGDNEGVITTLEERKSLLARPDPFNQRKKPIAANVEQIVIVTAPEPGVDLLQIDQIMVAAEATSIASIIVINKSDLLTAESRDKMDEKLHHYRNLDTQILWTSTKTSNGIEPLQQQLTDKSSVLVGPSGAGKSSIIKQLLPDHEIAVGALSAGISKGKHTTSVSTLYQLNGGGSLIDSPGIREFGIWDLDEETIRNGFREFDEYAGRCRFSNCRHLNEPGCAISEAVTAGELSAGRVENYRQLISK